MDTIERAIVSTCPVHPDCLSEIDSTPGGELVIHCIVHDRKFEVVAQPGQPGRFTLWATL